MIKELIKQYGNLCDSWIDEISINRKKENVIEEITISIGINCANTTNYNYEKIILVFEKVIKFNIKENHSLINFSPKEVFIKSDEGKIILDFDPIDNFEYLEENVDSNFKIVSKKFTFKK